ARDKETWFTIHCRPNSGDRGVQVCLGLSTVAAIASSISTATASSSLTAGVLAAGSRLSCQGAGEPQAAGDFHHKLAISAIVDGSAVASSWTDMNLASVTAYNQAMEPMNSMKDLKQIEPTLIENWREQHDQEPRREQQCIFLKKQNFKYTGSRCWIDSHKKNTF
ncbi:hypothetical protein EJB05_31136, partial [Eragrostis curvula]